MCRGEVRNINSIVCAIDRYGVVSEAGTNKVADHVDRVTTAASHTLKPIGRGSCLCAAINAEFFNIGEFRDNIDIGAS